MSKITIIITLYNVEQFVHETLLSVINQTYHDLEIICVNDGSTDNTLFLVEEIANREPRIKIINQANSGRAAVPINVGLDHATGTDIFILDGDDTLSPDAISKMKDRQTETDADFVVCDLCLIYPAKDCERNWAYRGINPKPRTNSPIIDRSIILSGKEAVALTLFDWKLSGKALYRSRLFEALRFNEKGTNGDEFTTRHLMLISNRIAFSEGEYYYNQHGSSITNNLSVRYFDRFQADDDLYHLLMEHNFDSETIRKFQIKRINKIAKYRRKLARNKHLLPLEQHKLVIGLLDDAMRAWLHSARHYAIRMKLIFLYTYLKRRYA